ncbi:homocysteine S-methyltransferase [Branchiibius hedensis]|uniref:Homocysteine S-methyltransferase n=1 Tax=Branchiibius hedensis TaxID=672460 RepID=A0A2Y8ZVK2_9MICO|nr:homocysteine S-methyltransferase [Branchiibius hedensis]PWJ25112.1 homocysteine S-methyltransferase [Branchiibius hedensis]SSA33927.1 homocysteine S-methyltransferase [Branchiibius hedensis]
MTVVLDGGLSNALVDRGHDLADDLWTARLLADAPQEIVAVHRAYFAAGAQLATSASYQASVLGFTAAGMSTSTAEELIRRSVRLAREATDGVPGRLVAASVGPYGAVLGDGSEYRGNYGLTAAQLRDFHAPRLELLIAEQPDLLAVETIPDLLEAQVLVDLIAQFDVPAWLSFTIDGAQTRAGQPLADAFAVATDAPGVVAVGVNCCAPREVLPAIELAGQISGKPAVAYPNAGETWDAEHHRWVGEPTYDVRLVPRWLDAGARWVGGCCRVGPAGIAQVAAAVAARSA